MGKGALKYGTSGVLPKTREIFKNPIKPVPVDPSIVQGYAPNITPPKGVKRQPPVAKVVDVETLAKKTMPSPKVVKDPSTVPESQMWKMKQAELRREYLQSAYVKEVRRLEYEEEKVQRIKEKEEEEERISKAYTESAATTLTLPTISEYLKGPLMRQRTPEETELLQEKRVLNRMNLELAVKTEKASKLLELYYEAGNFITTEAELAATIETEFSNDSYKKKTLLLDNMLLPKVDLTAKDVKETEFSDDILGTLDGKAGLPQIEEYLSGHMSKSIEKAKAASRPTEKDEIDGAPYARGS